MKSLYLALAAVAVAAVMGLSIHRSNTPTIGPFAYAVSPTTAHASDDFLVQLQQLDAGRTQVYCPTSAKKLKLKQVAGSGVGQDFTYKACTSSSCYATANDFQIDNSLTNANSSRTDGYPVDLGPNKTCLSAAALDGGTLTVNVYSVTRSVQ